MARSTKSKELNTKEQKTTALAPWDEELAQFAEEAAASEQPTGGYKHISLRGGVMTIDDQPVPDNQLDLVVLAAVYENQFFDGDYDPEASQTPSCYAFGKGPNAEQEMAPHEKAPDKQHDKCAGCPNNEWGSAERGRGKACKNVRRLAVVAEDALESVEAMEQAEVRNVKISVTNVKHWSNYVRSKLAELKRPPFAVVTTMGVRPDPKTQFQVSFRFKEAIDFGEVPGLYEAIKAKVREAEDNLMMPYPVFEDNHEERQSKRRLPPAKGAKKGVPRRRR